MKHFDIARYEQQIKADPHYEGFAPDKDHYVWEHYRLDPDYLDEGYDKALVAGYVQANEDRKEAIKEVFQFDREGRLQSTATYFSTSLEIGIWRRWNERGQLVTETDKDKSYPFALPQVLDFARQKGADLRTTGTVKRRYDSALKQYVWLLSWVVDYKKETYQQSYLLDGISGKVLQQERGPAPVLYQ
ncbi:hypothetical protein [Taibaiella koreensis]|uniref:hypothetical protein n=1 Tax=Taibaiella koreensis TaxID=1268548 RepID=UPI0013C2F477|nr:hypothetical protein [Taibaiella koreensis]